jgi:hypothetical protein
LGQRALFPAAAALNLSFAPQEQRTVIFSVLASDMLKPLRDLLESTSAVIHPKHTVEKIREDK